MSAIFEQYRFSLLIERVCFQSFLFNNETISSIDELDKIKLRIFKETLIDEIKSGKDTIKGQEYSFNILEESGDFVCFLMNIRRKIKRQTCDFKTERLDSWPVVWVFVDFAKQKIFMQKNSQAWEKTSTPVNALISRINDRIVRNSLSCEVSPLKIRSSFWRIVDSHEGKIQSITFELISPNMPDIAQSMQIDIKELRDNVGVKNTVVTLEAGAGSSLVVPKDNTFINGAVKYTEEGCGNIKIHLRKARGTKIIETNEQKRTTEVEFDDVSLETTSAEGLRAVVETIKKALTAND